MKVKEMWYYSYPRTKLLEFWYSTRIARYVGLAGYILEHRHLPKMINSNQCRRCKSKATLFEEFDMYACLYCNEWLEYPCKPEPTGVIYFPTPQGSPHDSIASLNNNTHHIIK